MQRKLIDFLHRSAERPFAYGRNDCSLLLAGWWKCIHGVDPARELRGTYSTDAEKDALLEREGGLLALVERLAAGVGAPVTETPSLGDFGVIEHHGKPFGAICAGTAGPSLCWAIRTEKGVGFLTNPKVLKAWSIHELG